MVAEILCKHEASCDLLFFEASGNSRGSFVEQAQVPKNQVAVRGCWATGRATPRHAASCAITSQAMLSRVEACYEPRISRRADCEEVVGSRVSRRDGCAPGCTIC